MTGLNQKTQAEITANAAFYETWIGTPGIIESLLAQVIDMQTDVHSELESIRTALADMQNTFGTAAGGPETTLAGLLTIIQANTRCAPRACPPGPDDVGGCPDAFASTGQVASTDYGGRTFAIWNVENLPPGVTVGSFLAHDVANGQIVHAVDGTWALFVQSNGSPTFSISPDLDTLYPTGEWINIDSNLDLAINTPTGTDCRAFLCTPSDFPFLECVSIDSVLSTIVGTSNGNPFLNQAQQQIPFNSIGSITTSNQMTYQDFGTVIFETSVAGCVVTSNTHGWTITWENNADSACHVDYVDNLGAHGSINIGAPGGSLTIGLDTSYLMIDNRVIGSPADQPFTVQICPPA